MTLRGTLIPVLCAVTVNAVAVNAVAAPHLSVTTDGNCPDRAMLASAMTAKGFTVPPASEPVSYTLTIRALRGGAALQLSDASGARVVARQFTSTDCRAMAEAMAVVVEAYFVDLGTVGDRARAAPPSRTPEPQPASAPSAPAAPSAASTNTVPAQDAAGSTLTPLEAPRANTSAAGSTASNPATNVKTPKPYASTAATTPASDHKAAPAEVPHAKPVAAAPASGLGATPQTKQGNPSEGFYPRGFLGVGGLLALPASAGSTMTFDIGVGMDLKRLPISPEIVFASSLPVTTGERPDRVQRWANQGSLRVSAPFAGGVRVRPWAALGLALVRLQETDLPPPPPVKTTRSLVVGAGVELGMPIVEIWSARFDLGCTMLAERDEYYVQVERIGAGPWATCHAVLGIAVGGKPSSQ